MNGSFWISRGLPWKISGAKGSRALVVSRLIESVKLAELAEVRTRRAESVGLVLPVAVANRHAAKQHLVRRQLEVITDGVVEPRPGFLRASVEAVAARKEGESVDIAPEVGPLARAE